MYFPYLRCKQNELQLLEENVDFLSQSKIFPILEPVKHKTERLNKTLQNLANKNIPIILALNPKVGEIYEAKKKEREVINFVLEETQKSLSNYSNCMFGYILTTQSDLQILENLLLTHKDRNFAIIHNEAFQNPSTLIDIEKKHSNVAYHIFVDQGSLYENTFQNSSVKKITIKDVFKKRTNSDYPERELFSDIHLTYAENNMQGFGDFLIVGKQYSDKGGAAKALAIHMTHTNPQTKLMYVSHFVSDTNESSKNPAGKFYEALSKLAKVKDDGEFFKGVAYDNFMELYAKQHYPGLGVIKKISMHHHLELMNALL